MAPGLNRFDLAPLFARDGKLETYRSDRPVGGGSRMGPQNMVCCGRALQMLARWPGLWEERYRKHFSTDVLARYVDGPISLEGKSEAFGAPLDLGRAMVALTADASSLYLAGQWQGAEVTLELYDGPDAGGRKAEVVLHRDGQVRARGEKSAPLLCEHRVAAGAGATHFSLKLPFMIQKKQAPWWTAFEHGRYSVRCGEAVRNVYVMSTEERVRRELRTELAGGLRTWRSIFRDRGYIPTGLGNLHRVGTAKADDLSDTGGYAHLIASGAQYLLSLDGRCDWEDGQPASTGEKK